MEGLELAGICRWELINSEKSECILVWTSKCGTRAKESDSNHWDRTWPQLLICVLGQSGKGQRDLHLDFIKELKLIWSSLLVGQQ